MEIKRILLIFSLIFFNFNALAIYYDNFRYTGKVETYTVVHLAKHDLRLIYSNNEPFEVFASCRENPNVIKIYGKVIDSLNKPRKIVFNSNFTGKPLAEAEVKPDNSFEIIFDLNNPDDKTLLDSAKFNIEVICLNI